jgi:hypothetical protein
MANSLTLKWGTVKDWHLETDEAAAAIQKWADFGVSMSAATHNDSPEQKQALLEAIDLMDEIWLDWEGKKVSREEAKKYVLNFGKATRSDDAPCPLSKWWRKYRIMPDIFGGYQVEVWKIWFPFWVQVGFVNTHCTREAAVKFATRHARPDVL